MSNDLKVILVLVVGAIVVGIVLYLPFLLWFKWQRHKTRDSERTEVHVTRAGWAFYTIDAIVFLGCMAIATLYPNSTLGSAVQAIGQFTFVGLMALASYAMDRLVVALGYPLARNEVVRPDRVDSTAA